MLLEERAGAAKANQKGGEAEALEGRAGCGEGKEETGAYKEEGREVEAEESEKEKKGEESIDIWGKSCKAGKKEEEEEGAIVVCLVLTEANYDRRRAEEKPRTSCSHTL